MTVRRVRKVQQDDFFGGFNPMTMLWDMIRTAPWQMKLLMAIGPLIALAIFATVVFIVLAVIF